MPVEPSALWIMDISVGWALLCLTVYVCVCHACRLLFMFVFPSSSFSSPSSVLKPTRCTVRSCLNIESISLLNLMTRHTRHHSLMHVNSSNSTRYYSRGFSTHVCHALEWGILNSTWNKIFTKLYIKAMQYRYFAFAYRVLTCAVNVFLMTDLAITKYNISGWLYYAWNWHKNKSNKHIR